MILILVLGLMLIFSLISIHLIQSALLMWQLSHHLESQFSKNREMEKELDLHIKSTLKKIKTEAIIPKEAIFVPDHLSFGLTSGILVMPVKIPHNTFQSYIAFRQQ